MDLTQTMADRRAVMKRVHGHCEDCRRRMTDHPGPDQLNLDHPFAFAEYGPIDPRDARGICRTCNLDKSDMDLWDWLNVLADELEL